jgi:RNA polymerase sigma-70 factor (ECF subfamily)
MEYTSAMALGGFRERLGQLGVRRANLPDEELVTRALKGDLRSYEELMGRYEGLVRSILYAYGGREASVDDLTQETFLRAYDRLESFNPDYKFKTWISAIANNLGIDTLRRRRETVEFEPGKHAQSGGGPEAVALEGERARQVQDAVMSLPEIYRVPVILRYNQDMSYAEISEALGISVQALKSRLFRARGMLAEKLGEAE